jgi:hypothetical protein
MSSVEIFALIVLPAMVAAGGFAAAVFYDHQLANHPIHDGASFNTRSELSSAFENFESYFLDSGRRYSSAQLHIIHAPLGSSPN